MNTLFLFAININIIFFEFFLCKLDISFSALIDELLLIDLSSHWGVKYKLFKRWLGK